MQGLFLKLLELSLTGSLFALAVMLVRLVFRKAPRWIFCVLWGVVALRLILPVSIESNFSIVPEPIANGQLIANVGERYVGNIDVHYESNAGFHNAVEAGRQPIYSNDGYYVVTEQGTLDAPATIGNTVFPVLSWIWVAGMAVMLAYLVISYLVLRRKMAEATLLRDNIWQSEQVDSPFVLGIIKPRIYLPYTIAGSDMANVIAHEQAHIRRKDHWWKPIGFLLLAVYWFNPVMWVAYVLLCRDIEAACDEKVIKHMEKDEMRAYSAALLHCSVHRHRIAACPLAFGEVSVKERIKRVMNYKRPAFWIVIIALICAVLTAVCFLTDPLGNSLRERKDNDAAYIQSIEIKSGYGSYEVTAGPSKEYVLTFLSKIKISSSPVSQNRSEDRDKSNAIILKTENISISYYFSEDCSLVWIDDLVKPSLSSKVYAPELVKQFFASYIESPAANDSLLVLVQQIVRNPECAASSNPFDYIEAKRALYNEILSYGSSAVDCFVEQLRSGENSLQGYIMAVACADITGIGNKDAGADWATAQQWLALYDKSDKDIIIPPVIATDYISGKQARLMSFGYNSNKPGQSVIACGLAPWQGDYGENNTLVLDGENGQNQILLAPQGFSLSHYGVYLPDGTIYDDGNRMAYDSLSLRVMYSNEGICLIAPFQTGEYIYEVVLTWPEEELTVTYGFKVIMTGEESDYDRAVKSVFAAYGEGNPRIAVSLADKYTIANAASSSPRYLFKVDNVPNGPVWVEVCQLTGEIIGEVDRNGSWLIDPPYVDGELNYFDSGPIETVNGNLKTYYKNTDGTWQVDGRNYKYRLIVTGRMKNAAVDSTFVYLSNVETITFDQAWKAAGYSSDKADYFDVEDAVLVEWLSGGSKAMTLTDVVELSKLGMKLTWEDLKAYRGEDIGSGLYVVRYDIDREFYLLVGDGKTTGEPMYAYLNAISNGASCDIRQSDVVAFIQENQGNALD